MAHTRSNPRRLPGVTLPETVSVSAEIADFDAVPLILLAMPMQALAGFLADHGGRLDGRVLIACAKGIDLASGRGPSAIIAAACPAALPALLTGPSFAADIARGLPTALTLACADEGRGAEVQAALSTPVLQALPHHRHDRRGTGRGAEERGGDRRRGGDRCRAG